MGYRHTQVGTVILVFMEVGIVAIIVLSLALGWNPAGIVALVLLSLAELLFGWLTVEVRDGVLECRFGPGLIRKRFALADVRSAEPVRNRWYYGWGIRLIPGGWLYNVSGLDAVEIGLASGKRYRIGTDQPQQLAEAIRSAIPAPSPAA